MRTLIGENFDIEAVRCEHCKKEVPLEQAENEGWSQDEEGSDLCPVCMDSNRGEYSPYSPGSSAHEHYIHGVSRRG